MAPERILRKIAALDAKTIAAGCTPAEAAAAARLADGLRATYSAHGQTREPGLIRRPAAHGTSRLWTAAEDAVLRAWAARGADLTHRQLAALLDRTHYAVRRRLQRLCLSKGSR